jgi:integrase
VATPHLPQALEENLRAFTQSLSHLEPGTRKNTLSKLTRFLNWAASRGLANCTTWRDTNPALLDEFVQHRLGTPSARGFWPKPETISRDLVAIRDWLVWNEERELTGPIRSAHAMRPLPRAEREEIHVITVEQENVILDRARWVQDGARGLRFPNVRDGREVMTNARQTGWLRGAFSLYVLLMLRCGLRPAEALKLRWDEVFLDANPPVLQLRRRFDEYGRPLRKLKTAKSQDAITIARYVRVEHRDQWSGPAEGYDLVELLRDFRDELKQADAYGPWVFGKCEPFTGEVEYPDDAFIWRALKYETGDARVKAYSLRHTLGTRLAARGFTAEQVARVLRNTARVCERYYIAGTREHDAFDIRTGQRVQVRHAAG